MLKRLIYLLPLLLLPLLGCGAGGDMERYFALPQPVEEYRQLYSLIESEQAEGFELAAPRGGERRQAIQMGDLDGDGTAEAMVFLRSTVNDTVETLFFHLDRGSYRQVLRLRGAGSSVEAVDLYDLDGDGTDEIIFLYGTGAELGLMEAYSLDGWGGAVLLTAPCSRFLCCDADGDGRGDLAAVTLTGPSPSVTVYTFPKGSETLSSSAPLSRGLDRCVRCRSCTLEGNTPAVLVESFLESGELVSDLFTLLEGSLFNITLDVNSGVSRTRRSYAVYAADIDNDHFLEIPMPTSLFSQSFTDHNWALSWMGYSRYGQSQMKLETYHCFSDGWYLELPPLWSDSLTVRRADNAAGERCVILSDINRSTGEITDKLIIYTLSGESRAEHAALAGRFIVAEDDSVIYAARILTGLTEEEVRERFHLIYTEWSPGSL